MINAISYAEAAKTIQISSLDPVFFDNRLQFSYIENPRSVSASVNAPRDYKETATVRISNSGSDGLDILGATLDGPFALTDAAAVIGRTIEAGQFLDVTVKFVRALHTPPTANTANGVFTGNLELQTSDAGTPVVTVELAGFWQAKDENNWEPNVNEVWQVFGFGNFIPNVPTDYYAPNNPLNRDSIYESSHPTEILSPYWRIAEGFASATITQIAAFHGPGGATIGIHAPGSKASANDEIFWNHQGDANQTLLPLVGTNNAFATRVFDRTSIPDAWAGDDIFGIEAADFSTDPTLNPGGTGTGVQRGHLTRMFQALDREGNVIPNVFLGIQDYSGVNYDYNDNMFVIEGVEPVSGSQPPAPAPQSAFNTTTTPWAVGATTFSLAANLFDNGGQGVAYNDTTPGKQPNSGTNRPGTDVDVNNSNGAVGWIANGEWLEYTINVAAAGTYDLSLLLSNGGTVARTAQVDFFRAGEATAYAGTGTIQNPSGAGFGTFVPRTATGLTLEAGVQVVRVTFPNSAGAQDFQSFSLSRVDPPVITSAAAASVAENQTAAIDVDATDANGGTLTYAISGTDAGLFNINASTGLVTFKTAPNFEAPADAGGNNVYNFTVAVSDGRAPLTTQAIAITVTDVFENAAPVITSLAAASVAENQTAAIDVNATDANNDTLTYAISGTDAALFNINASTGVVTFKTAPNFEAPADAGANNVYNFTVAASDGRAPLTTQAIAITVTDVFENAAPVITSLAAASVAENQTAAIDVNATDANGDALTYAISGTDAALFNIDAQTGLVTFKTAPNFEAPADAGANNVYDIVVSVTDHPVGHDTMHDHSDHNAMHDHAMPAGGYTDINAFGSHPGVSMHIHVDALEGGRTPITTEALVIYNGLRSFLGRESVELETIGEWAFANQLTNNPVPYGQDLKGVGLYYAMQGSKVAWIDDDAYDPQILADIQRTARLGDPDDVMAMVRTHGHAGLAEYLEHEGLAEAFVNTLKMEPHYGGWKHGRAHGTLRFENAEGHRAPANTATAHDVNHLTVVDHAQAQPFYNDTFDWPQWAGRMVADDVVINYFQSMVTLGDPMGQGIVAADIPPVHISPIPTTTTQAITITVTDVAEQTAFNATNTPWLIDDVTGLTLRAQLFDQGGQGVAYNDTTAGKQPNSSLHRTGTDVDVNNSNGAIGWIANGEWLEYTVNVETAGVYDASLLLSGISNRTAQLDFFKPGATTAYESSGIIQNPSTGGFASFLARSVGGLELDAGEQVVRVSFPNSGSQQDFQSFSLTRTAFLLDESGLAFRAASYDRGGQGVGYSDQVGLQGGTDGGRVGSDVEIAPTGAVGWIANNEWLQYTIDVKDAGSYELGLTMALGIPNAPRQVRAEFFRDGVEIEEAIFTTPSTGSWTVFQDTSQTVDLTAGVTVMRLTFLGGAQDLLRIGLDYIDPLV